MSAEKKNHKTVLLGVFLVVVLIGVCFVCVTFYAKNEMNKPKFTMPKQPETPALTETLTDKDKAFAYAMEKYTDTVSADNTEVRWRTELRLGGDWDTQFSAADEAFLLHIRDHAGKRLASFYRCEDKYVRLNKTRDVPQIHNQAYDVLDFNVTLGRYNDDGKLVDTGRYFLTLIFDPDNADTDTLTGSETFKKIEDELSPVAALSDTTAEPQALSMCFVFDRITEELLSVDIMRDLRVKTTIRLNDDSSALLSSQEGTVVLPYGTTQKIEFKQYGVHFTEQALAVKPGDLKSLPVEVKTADNDSYSLTFTASEPGFISFDKDNVMSVGKEACDDPLTVTVTLMYDGHTYTDEMTVYISEWEAATDVGA